ncbi:MAG: sn-glycerol-3-phosphate ABC transporter substrate-binding protein UgpB [Geminicoccaceae bacterium]|nr:sn-glycerol-3-phosphate ABC transporter substrate-binding protein UgpB [Geminicoccaceae bacterium]MDW8341897.1 sn-glycerol-3-phosphate ABC transporter substrate-binding protein UgpB [Geminicoccaceae bacterium]
MIAKTIRVAGAAAIALFAGATAAEARIEIQFWHALSGPLGERTAKLAADFNASQNEYEVKAIYKGTYAETMTGAIAAFRAKQHPHIVQVFEVGTATMMAARGAVYPVYQLMADAGEPFDPKGFLPAVVGYYTTAAGEMLSMPFNSSTPVMYYNKDAFKKAGLDPERPPTTWPAVEEAAKKLLAAGYPCGFTTQWPSWIQVENWSAWHNQPLGTLENGFGGLATELVINKTRLVEHIKALGEWQKTKIFDYGGRRGDADPKFFNQQCPIFLASSAAYAAVRANAKDFAWGIGKLPYWPHIEGAPQNTIIGGASLWVLRGHKPEEYKGVAKFFTFLSSPEVQARWHQETGYLPITPAAYELTKKQGFYEKNPGTETAILQITNKPPTANSKGLRFGNFVQIRDIIEEELEAVFQGKKSAQDALDAAARRGNELLRQFEKAQG